MGHDTVFETRHVGESVAGAARGALTRSGEEAAVIRWLNIPTRKFSKKSYFSLRFFLLLRIRAEQEAARIAEGIRGVYGVIEERMQVDIVKN